MTFLTPFGRLAARCLSSTARANPLATTALCALSIGLATAPAARADVPGVVVDIAPVHSLVAQVMGDLGSPELILPPGASPHSHALRPSDARALQSADLVVWVGEELTPWLEDSLESLSENASTLTLIDAPGLTLFEIRQDAVFTGGDDGHGHGHDHEEHADDHGDEHDHEEHADAHGHEHDKEEHAEAHGDEHDHDEHAASHDDDHEHGEDQAHAHDDEHGHEEHADAHDDEHGHEEHADAHDDHHGHDHAHEGTDPHIWLSPENARVIVASVAEALSAADPDNADTYAANAAAARDRLTALEADLAERLAPVSGAPFVVFHDAYRYFEDSFGLSTAGAISVSDARAPSAARLAELREHITEVGAVCVAAEPQYDPGLVTAVGEGTGMRTAVLDPLGVGLEPGPDLYAGVLTGLSDALTGCLADS